MLGPVLFVHPSMLVDPSTGDQAVELLPWTHLAWTEVHNGHLPLWNPYSVLGAPLAFNWQSAAFGVPALVGYLFPIGWAFTVGMLTTLVVAGTGVYVLARMLKLGVVGAVVAAVFFELSGSFLGWLGWPVASVASWIGWLVAAALLIVRGRHRMRGIFLFAAVVALSVYAGQPDTLALVALGLGIFVVALLAQRTAALKGSGEILRPVVDLVVGGVAGAALSAPLLLPGLQVTRLSIRGAQPHTPALAPHFLAALVVPLFNGLAVPGSRWIGGQFVQGVGYVGIVAGTLAVVGVVRHRTAEMRAFVVLGLAALALVYLPPAVWLVGQLGRSVQWARASQLLLLAVAVLAGAGTDSLLRRRPSTRLAGGLALGIAAGALVILVLWLTTTSGLPFGVRPIRVASFFWPVITTAIALVLALALYVATRRARDGERAMLRRGVPFVVMGLVLCQTGLLLSAGLPLWTASGAESTQPQQTIEHLVGGSLLGFGESICFPYSLAIVQDTNLDFGVQEFDVYDPMTPKAYYRSYFSVTGSPGGLAGPAGTNKSFFCPSIKSAKVARLYGVRYVIEPKGTRPFPGAVLAQKFKNGNRLYRVPGAAPATLVPLGPGPGFPPTSARGTPLRVTHAGPASWTVRTDAATASVLRLRLTDMPGWKATIDGRPLDTARFAGVMLQARVPPGKHVVELHYWPSTFTAGLAIAGVSLVALVAGSVVAVRRRRLPA